MDSLILRTATRVLLPLMLLLSLYVLLRGHNEPGGGFIGGLIASAAYALYMISHGVTRVRETLRWRTITLVAVGLMLALLAASLPLLVGRSFFTGLWLDQPLPVLGKVGTPTLFDVGVYLVVMGVVLRMVFAMAQLEEAEYADDDSNGEI